MMRRSIAAAAVLSMMAAAPAAAQEELLQSCKAAAPDVTLPDEVREQYDYLCAQVVNMLATVQPSFGIAFSGANPVLGTASNQGMRLGMIPRVSVSARVNAAFTKLPDLGGYVAEVSGSQQLEAMDVIGVPLPALQVDAAVGVFNGMPLGLGAVDLLGSVSFIPRIDIADYPLNEAIVNVGGGARIGILKQGLLMPGVSVSGMYRRMGTVSLFDVDEGDAGEFGTDLSVISLRAIASKGLLLFDFALGAGYDRYSSEMSFGWRIECETAECLGLNGGAPLIAIGRASGNMTTAAWNVFGNVGLDLFLLNLVAEVGYQKATSVLGREDLENADLPSQGSLTKESLSGGRPFASFGVRISI